MKKIEIGFVSPLPNTIFNDKKTELIFIPSLFSSIKKDFVDQISEEIGFSRTTPTITKFTAAAIKKYNIPNVLLCNPTDIKETLIIPDVMSSNTNFHTINYYDESKLINSKLDKWLSNIYENNNRLSIVSDQYRYENFIKKIKNRYINNGNENLPKTAMIGEFPLFTDLLDIVNNLSDIRYIEFADYKEQSRHENIFTDIKSYMEYIEKKVTTNNISHLLLIYSSFSSKINYEIIFKEKFKQNKILTVEINSNEKTPENVLLRIESFFKK